MNKLSLIMVCAFSIVVNGCASMAELKPEASQVKIQNGGKPPEGCLYVKEVSASQEGSGLGNDSVKEGANNDLKNKAHEASANFAMIMNSHNRSSTGNWPMPDKIMLLQYTAKVFKCP